MADVVNEKVKETIEETIVETAKNVSTKVPATPEGMAVAYGSLVVMALLPIYFGAFRSIKSYEEQKKQGEKTGNTELISNLEFKRTMFFLLENCLIFTASYSNLWRTVLHLFINFIPNCGGCS